MREMEDFVQRVAVLERAHNDHVVPSINALNSTCQSIADAGQDLRNQGLVTVEQMGVVMHELGNRILSRSIELQGGHVSAAVNAAVEERFATINKQILQLQLVMEQLVLPNYPGTIHVMNLGLDNSLAFLRLGDQLPLAIKVMLWAEMDGSQPPTPAQLSNYIRAVGIGMSTWNARHSQGVGATYEDVRQASTSSDPAAIARAREIIGQSPLDAIAQLGGWRRTPV
jgi:hypothetical protein